MNRHTRTRKLKPRKENGVRQSLLDKVVSYFDPVVGYKRLQAKAFMALTNGYVGASNEKRSLASYKTAKGDADADMLEDIQKNRERCRQLVRNNPLAAGAVNTNVTNVVGTGLKLQSRIDANFLNMTPEQADAWEKNTEREFRLWAESVECDLERTLDFYDIQDVCFRSCLESGDIFVLLPMINRSGSPYQTRLQLIEADRVSNPYREIERPQFTCGVEKDENGAPLRYHILNHHPGSRGIRTKATWIPIEAFGKTSGRRNIIHLFAKKRPGQTRGVPYLAPVIEPLKQLGDYTEAEITAAVVSGLFSVFVKTPTGEGITPNLPASENGAAEADEFQMSPGQMVDLMPGEDVTFADPARPNTAFDPFVMAVLRQIGVALEIPFEILIKHFTASYSAARAAMLEAWRYFMNRRAWLAKNLCQPVYEAFMWEAVSAGRISAPGFFKDPAIRKAYLEAQWLGPARGQIDELKEVKAAALRIQTGISTLKEETAQMTGGDFDTNHRQRAKEIAMRREAGLEPEVQPPADTQDNSPAADQGDLENA